MLDGMRVVSFCHYLQGPACSQYLADLGADVIKVEPPRGAFERHWSGGKSFVNGVSAFLLCANRNKRSLSIDLKHSESKDVMLRLVAGADVIVENFRPGVLSRYGLGYDDIKAFSPAIIYASASGFGSTGPARDRPGQDLLMQARSGLMAATGNRETGPVAVGCAPVDQHGGALLALGIAAAYIKRLKTGKGTHIEGNLFNAAIDLQAEALTKYMAARPGADIFQRDPHVGSWYHNAPYGVYALADAHIALSMNKPDIMASVLDSAVLRDMQTWDLYEHRDAFAQAVAQELASRSFADLAPLFDKHAIWFERIQTYEDLATDPQALHNQIFQPFAVGDRQTMLVNHPLRYDGALPKLHRMPLAIGQDSREILAEIGYAPEEVDALIEAGVVVAETVPAPSPNATTD